MPIVDIYSKRNNQDGNHGLIFTFNKKVRVQISYIIIDALGEAIKMPNIPDKPEGIYRFIHDTLCRELGYQFLGQPYGNYKDRVINALIESDDPQLALNIIDLAFRLIDISVRNDVEYSNKFIVITKITPDDAILEVNHRFTENNIGFRYLNGMIYKIDSDFSYIEITKPTLDILKNPLFKGINEEYIKAHEHYKFGNNKDSLTWALKSFESTLKIICEIKGWGYKQNDSSKRLLDICFTNYLIPQYLQSEFTSLRALLESGIPTIRNTLGGHGQGVNLIKVDNNITSFCLNLTGSSIIYLIEQAELD